MALEYNKGHIGFIVWEMDDWGSGGLDVWIVEIGGPEFMYLMPGALVCLIFSDLTRPESLIKVFSTGIRETMMGMENSG
jgi:hypothetical protein